MAEQWWSKYEPTEYSFAEWKTEANRLYKEEGLTKEQIQEKIGYPVDDQGNAIKTTNKGSKVNPKFDTRTGDRASQGARRGAAAASQTVGEDVYNKGVVAPSGSGLQEHHKRVVGLYKPFFEGLDPKETKELAQWFVDEGAPLGNVEGNLEALTEQQHEAIHTWMKENRMQVSNKKFPSFKNVPLNERFVAALTFLEQIQPAADEELAKIKATTDVEMANMVEPESQPMAPQPEPDDVKPTMPTTEQSKPDRVQEYMRNKATVMDAPVPKTTLKPRIDPKIELNNVRRDLFDLNGALEKLRMAGRSGRFRI